VTDREDLISPPSEAWPADPAHSGVPIQRAPLADEPIPDEWLELPDLVEQAERLDRLAADFDLVTNLALPASRATIGTTSSRSSPSTASP
jgi:hypothetical protein